MIKGFDGKKIETVGAFLDYISDNTGEWCWNDEKLTILAEEFLENQRIVERLKQDKEDMGRSLVDVQNWLSKDGKKITEIVHGYIQSILKVRKGRLC